MFRPVWVDANIYFQFFVFVSFFILYFIFFDLLSVCNVWLLLFTRIKVFTFFVSCYFNNIITFWMTVLNTLTVKQSLLYGMWMKRKQKWTENRKKWKIATEKNSSVDHRLFVCSFRCEYMFKAFVLWNTYSLRSRSILS